MSEQRTEKATPKKKQDARKKGQVNVSRDLTKSSVLMALLLLLQQTLPNMMTRLNNLFSTSLSQYTGDEIQVSEFIGFTGGIARDVIMMTLPLLGAAAGISILAQLLQSGFLVSLNPLKPKLSNLSPIQGIKRMFSLRTVVELLKGFLKVGVIAAIGYVAIKDAIPEMVQLGSQSIIEVLIYTGRMLSSLLFKVAMGLLALSVLDYVYQWWEHEKKLKMTKQEVKDESKQQEGDPQVKGRIRQVQRQMSTRRMMQMVPQADVIIRNPTHYAVALKYDQKETAAPVVLAKGQDRIAERILEIAGEHKIDMVENPPLARSLYKLVEVGDEIPFELYQAVAEVLAYVYQLNNQEGR